MLASALLFGASLRLSLSPSPPLHLSQVCLTDADRRRMADTLPSEPRRREEGGRKGVTWVPPPPAVRAGASATDAGGSPPPPPLLRAPVGVRRPAVEADRPRRREPPPVPAVAAGAGTPAAPAADGGRPAEPVAADAARRRRVETPGVGSGRGKRIIACDLIATGGGGGGRGARAVGGRVRWRGSRSKMRPIEQGRAREGLSLSGRVPRVAGIHHPPWPRQGLGRPSSSPPEGAPAPDMAVYV